MNGNAMLDYGVHQPAGSVASGECDCGRCPECTIECSVCTERLRHCVCDVVHCDVAPEFATRFEVTLHTGRRFVGCGIQGSGGALHGIESLINAQRIRSRRVMLRLIVRDRADACVSLDVRCLDVATIARVRA